MTMLRRLWALIQKEFIQLIRDRHTLIAIMIGPALELILLAAAVHTDVKHIPIQGVAKAFFDRPSFVCRAGICGSIISLSWKLSESGRAHAKNILVMGSFAG